MASPLGAFELVGAGWCFVNAIVLAYQLSISRREIHRRIQWMALVASLFGIPKFLTWTGPLAAPWQAFYAVLALEDGITALNATYTTFLLTSACYRTARMMTFVPSYWGIIYITMTVVTVLLQVAGAIGTLVTGAMVWVGVWYLGLTIVLTLGNSLITFSLWKLRHHIQERNKSTSMPASTAPKRTISASTSGKSGYVYA